MKSILDYVYEESSKIDKNNQQKICDSINDAISKIDTIDGGVNMTDFVVSLIDEIYNSLIEHGNDRFDEKSIKDSFDKLKKELVDNVTPEPLD